MSTRPRCGLCGQNYYYLTKTECCNNWVCDDEHLYGTIPGYRSCLRGHNRYTLCHFHWAERHNEPDWKKCKECDQFEPEMYAWYTTNPFNFVKLKNPPKYEPKRCTLCNEIIRLASAAYMQSGDKYYCVHCISKMGKPNRTSPSNRKKGKQTSKKKRSESIPTSTVQKQSKKSTKLTVQQIEASLKDELKYKFGKNDTLLVELEKREDAKPKSRSKESTEKTEKRPSKRATSAPRVRSKPSLKQKNTQLIKNVSNSKSGKSSSKSRGKENNSSYGKRKASVQSTDNGQSKKVKKNTQEKRDGKYIWLVAQDTSSDSQRKSTSRGRTASSKSGSSQARSSSSSGRKEKKKVQWTKKKT